MKNFKLDDVFIQPIKKYYFGKIVHGTPYFEPIGFCSSIFKFRKLKLQDKDKYEKAIKEHPWLKDKAKFTNLPMVRRSKDWIFKLFNNYYWLAVGWPIAIRSVDLGWKDKFDTPRFEWLPSFHIYFFNWQFCIHWVGPNPNDSDLYYEMYLWYKNYCNRDIVVARNTWKWQDYNTKESTWNEDYINVQNEGTK